MFLKPSVLAASVALALAVPGAIQAADASPHRFRGSVDLEFRTNDDIRVAPSSTDSFDFAGFDDFAKAAEEEDVADEAADESDDTTDYALDDTSLSEDELELAIDDADGDGSEDDGDDDGVDDDEDDDDDGDGIDDSEDGDDDNDGIDDSEDDDDGSDGDDGEGDDGEGGDDSEGSSDNHTDLDKLLANQIGGKSLTTRKSQNRVTAKLGLGHKFAFENEAWTWGSSFRAVADFHNGNSQMNKTNFSVSTGPEYAPDGSAWKFKPAVSYVSIHKDNDEVLSTLVGTLAASYAFDKRFSVDGVYNYQSRDIVDPDLPDAIINTLTFGLEAVLTKQDIVKLRFSPKVEDSSRVTKNKDTQGWQATYSRKLPWDLIAGIGVKVDRIDFVNLPASRTDDVTAFSIELAKKFSKQFEMGVSYEERELDSSINSKDATNKSFLISGTYKF